MLKSLSSLLKDDTAEQFKESFHIITAAMNVFYKLHEAFTTTLMLIYYNSDLLICVKINTFKITLAEILSQQSVSIEATLKH